MNTPLTRTLQSGTVTYLDPQMQQQTVQGDFYIQHNNIVVCRKKRGRNMFALCHIDSVLDFTPAD